MISHDKEKNAEEGDTFLHGMEENLISLNSLGQKETRAFIA